MSDWLKWKRPRKLWAGWKPNEEKDIVNEVQGGDLEEPGRRVRSYCRCMKVMSLAGCQSIEGAVATIAFSTSAMGRSYKLKAPVLAKDM